MDSLVGRRLALDVHLVLRRPRRDADQREPASGAPLVTRAQALQQVFNWFFAQGCPDLTTCRLPLAYANIPGLTTLIHGIARTRRPRTSTRRRWPATSARSFAYRVDFVRREGRDFYNNVINGSTGTGSDEFGNKFDIGYINNTNTVERNYTGLHTSLSYRSGGFNGGVNWTWSHTLGNLNGETAASGPVPNATEHVPRVQGPGLEQPVRLARDGRAPPREALRVVQPARSSRRRSAR